MTNHPCIYVDADACPVKEEILEIASPHTVDLFFVASYAHVRTKPLGGIIKGGRSEEEAKESLDKNGHVHLTDIGTTTSCAANQQNRQLIQSDPTNYDEPRWIYVDSESEEVDLYIVNHAKTGDIVVTQDHGLASLLSVRGVNVLSPRGKRFLEEEMDNVLFERYLSAKKRRSGTHTKGPRKMSKDDRNRFRESFKRILSINEGKQS